MIVKTFEEYIDLSKYSRFWFNGSHEGFCLCVFRETPENSDANCFPIFDPEGYDPDEIQFEMIGQLENALERALFTEVPFFDLTRVGYSE